MTPVTDSPKCYVIPCVVCQVLYPAFRSDSRTCSTACRVALHRGAENRYAAGAQRTVDAFGGDPRHFELLARILDAVQFLRPDLMPACLDGSIADVRSLGPDLAAAYLTAGENP